MAKPKPKILLVEDEEDLATILRVNLKSEGYEFLHAKNGQTGLQMALKHKPNLIVSDIMMPEMDGLEMLRALRQESQVPVIFLTAKKSEVDRILGFKLGADDYLSKPFSVRELVCRISAILRRLDRRTKNRASTARIGEMEVDFGRHEVRISGKFRHLAPREFEFLTMLIEADGKVISREELLKRIWGIDDSVEISTRTVDQHMARLRRSLLSERRRIITVKKIGYRLKID